MVTAELYHFSHGDDSEYPSGHLALLCHLSSRPSQTGLPEAPPQWMTGRDTYAHKHIGSQHRCCSLMSPETCRAVLLSGAVLLCQPFSSLPACSAEHLGHPCLQAPSLLLCRAQILLPQSAFLKHSCGFDCFVNKNNRLVIDSQGWKEPSCHLIQRNQFLEKKSLNNTAEAIQQGTGHFRT